MIFWIIGVQNRKLHNKQNQRNLQVTLGSIIVDLHVL